MYEKVTNESSDDRRVVLVTGATGAIGFAIARQIADMPGYEVAVTSRDDRNGERTVSQLTHETGNPNVRYFKVDLSRKASVFNLAERWQGPLHVLINNAVQSPPTRQETPEGIELQFATNVLGYFWTIQAFTPVLERSAPARVVNVASGYAGHLDLDDLEFERRPYDNRLAYQQSKQANRMLTAAFAERLQGRNIAVNACYPGYVRSQLTRHLGTGGTDTPAEGARTPVWLATSPEAAMYSGRYFNGLRPVRDPFVEDRQAVESLYRICEGY